MVADREKWHVVFEDEGSGETLGLLLTEQGGLGRVARLASPYAAKVGGGDRTLSDLTDLSVYGQTTWHGGRGQDKWEDEEKFFDSTGVETRIKDQVTLGPVSVGTYLATATTPQYMPTSGLWGYAVGVGGDYLRRAQSFTAPAGGLSCTGCVLWLRKSGAPGVNYIVTLQADSGGLPGATLKSAAITIANLSTTSWDAFTFTWSTQALTAGNTYYIGIEPDGQDTTGYVDWLGDSAAGYSGGGAFKYQWPGTETWSADSTVDFRFQVNGGQTFPTAITVNPIRFNSGWYIASGAVVYKWNTSTSVWDSSESTTGTVTDLAVWGDYLYAARGANTMRRLNTSATWGDAPGAIQAKLLHVYGGYFYRTDPTNLEDFYYCSDGTGTTWSDAISVGAGDYPIRGLSSYNDTLVITTDVGMWLFYVYAYPSGVSWQSMEDTTNGTAVTYWPKSNELFDNIGYSLYRWTGAMNVSCGPDLGSGLPSSGPARCGKIAALCGTTNWLYAAVDAGASGTSSVMAYSGGTGWHEVVRAALSGQRIRSLGYETISSPPRLWWAEGVYVNYIELPDYTDNPYAFSGYNYAPYGYLDLSAWGSELINVVKDWRAVVVQAENCTSVHFIEVWYEVDRSGYWTYMGQIADARTTHKLDFSTSSFTTKTVGTSSTTTTIELATGSTTTDLAVGDWVRINSEIRQVSSITDSNTFVLLLPLSAAPSSGDYVYASAPAGAEIRLRLRFFTRDSSESPKLTNLALYCEANVADRWQITLSVRIEDKMECLDASIAPYDTTQWRTEIDKWVKRKTSFTFHDIDGVERTVKVANAVEQQPSRQDTSPVTWTSVMQLSLIEVAVSGT